MEEKETQATWAAQMAFATIGLSVHGRLLGSRPRRAQRSCFCATATRAVPRAFAKRAASSEESCEQSECEYLQGEEARSCFAQTATEKLPYEVAKKRERERERARGRESEREGERASRKSLNLFLDSPSFRMRIV